MKRAKKSRASAETRQALLEAAGELFAEKGFRIASTREICRKAGTDIAAIHYHFGNKEKLYEEVLKYADSLLAEPAPTAAGKQGRSREERLREMVAWVLGQCFAPGQPAWCWKFIEHATTELTPGLERFFQSRILPMYKALDSICREFLGEGAPRWQVRFATRSVLGQCFYYRHFRALLTATEAGETFFPERLNELANHIVVFSIAGLKAQARELKRARQRDSHLLRFRKPASRRKLAKSATEAKAAAGR